MAQVFTGAFPAGASEEFPESGRRPVIYDILGPDRETSILPAEYRLVCHVNPTNMQLAYTR